MGVGGCRTFQKLSHLGGGVPKILLKRRDNPEKVEKGGVDIKMGGCHFFYYFTVQLHLLCVCGGSKVSFISF